MILSKSLIKLATTSLIPFLCAMAPAQASIQPKFQTSGVSSVGLTEQRSELNISKEAMEKVRDILDAEDKKLMAAFNKNPAIKESLQSQIAKIAKITDSASKKIAIDTFQANNKKSYEMILKQAGVDLSLLTRRLNEVLPGFNLKLNSNLTISATVSTLPPLASDKPEPKTTTTALRDFTNSKELACGLAAGSSASFTASKLELAGIAAVAGGCTNNAWRKVNFDIPDTATAAQLKMKADVYVDGFAVGVAGSSGINADASMNEANVYITVIAPLFWTGYSEEVVTGARVSENIDLNLYRSTSRRAENYRNNISLVNSASVKPIAVIGETHGSAKITNFSVSLVVTTP
ncbi:hypothetical protein [Alteromonas sp. AMM-1]|uniref:hypothetical protein n=1 Tax=Alteromonas sp. AMM-1 TaxID=3394233 RepID=UPI0039A5FAC4